MGKLKNLLIELNEEYEALEEEYTDLSIAAEMYFNSDQPELGADAKLEAIGKKARMDEIEKKLAELSGQPQPGSDD